LLKTLFIFAEKKKIEELQTFICYLKKTARSAALLAWLLVAGGWLVLSSQERPLLDSFVLNVHPKSENFS
jgi:hypothetical protein